MFLFDSFSKYLLSSSYVTGAFLDTGYTAVNKIGQNSAFWSLYSLVGVDSQQGE